jgi:hypothetical protein
MHCVDDWHGGTFSNQELLNFLPVSAPGRSGYLFQNQWLQD